MPCDIQNGHVARNGAPNYFGAFSLLAFWQIDITPHKCHVPSLNCS